MGNIRMRLKFSDVEIEIEGAEAFVKKEFELQKQFVLSRKESQPTSLTNSSTNPSTSTTTPKSSSAETLRGDISDLPSLESFAANNSARTESDWLMGYAMYSSEGSQRTFNLKDLRDLYRATSRADVKRMNNIRNNMKTLLNKGLIVESAPSEFMLTNPGLRYGRQLLSGKSPSKFSKKTPGKRGRKPAADKSPEVQAEKYTFTDEQKASYQAYLKTKKPSKAADRIVVATRWFQEEMNEPIGLDALRALLSINGSIPGAFGAVVSQMRTKENALINSPERGKLALTDFGTEHLESLPKRKKKATSKAKAKGSRRGRKPSVNQESVTE